MRNPTRRNRNIGTAKSGHGQDNRLKIPDSHGTFYWERIENATRITRNVAGKDMLLFVQPTRPECIYPCTIDDIAHVLEFVPVADLEGLDAIVLRQARRKEEILCPVWGRFSYAADLVNSQGQLLYRGSAIVLEAVNPKMRLDFGKRTGLASHEEVERLIRDGHRLLPDRRKWLFELTIESCRATQLYRSLLHELGHWVDHLEKVERIAHEDNYELFLERFHQRPIREKEEFAHRYAERVCERLRHDGIIPFERKFSVETLKNDGLNISDFALT